MLGFFVSLGYFGDGRRGESERGNYRTVRAWSSIGAPERTAAGKTSPSSLPFMTLLGIGVNSL